MTKPNPPIKGHTLIGEGAIFPIHDHSWDGKITGHSGGCTCGAVPPHFPNVSTTKMKAWHREHKEELRAAMVNENPKPRPNWTKAVQFFLADTVMGENYDYPQDGSDDVLLEEIETAVNALLCRTYGHQIEDDQCMIPDHRYCIWCGRRANVL